MKKQFKLLSTLLVSATLVLISCKKEPEIPVEPTNYALKIIIDQLPGLNVGTNGFSALLSLTKANGETVLTDKAYALSYNGKYQTEAIPVAKGNYNLVKLIVLKPDGTVAFATPITGSIKAQQVNNPLSLAIRTEVATTMLNLQVIPVATTDRAQDYGYIAGTFNEVTTENPLKEFSLTIKPVFNIGNVVYDSIPVSMKLTSYSLQGEPTITIYALAPGAKKITLPKQASKYVMSISKWGIEDAVTILPNNMKDGMVYTLGGSKAAKKIKYESVYQQKGNSWTPDTRKEFLYLTNGNLNLINYYRMNANQSIVHERKDEMTYSNNRITAIKTTGLDGVKFSFFTYKADGKLEKYQLADNDGKTNAKISIATLPVQNDKNQDYSIGAEVTSTKFYYTARYSFDVTDGNVLKYNFSTTHGDYEQTFFDYDFGINPFVHLQIPELGHSYLSKNNVTRRWADYVTLVPQHDPYEYNYTYDADGYPIELYTKYRVPGTSNTAFTTKTVFSYY